MGRIRTIKPEFPHSESIGRISRDARLLFIQLWTICDDSGRTRGNSRMLASLLFPYDEDASQSIDRWLGELERESLVVRYIIEGDKYLQVGNWLKHQKIDKPSPSRFPAFDESSTNPRELSCEDQGPRTKEKDLKEERKGKPPESLPDPELVKRIICAHPKSILKNLKAGEVSQAQVTAVLGAMSDEISARSCTAPEALDWIMGRTVSLAENVPRDRWRFVKDVTGFYAAHDYRLEPQDFMRDIGGGISNGTISGKPGGAVARTERSQNAFLAAGERAVARIDEAGCDAPGSNGGGFPAPGVRNGHGGGLPDGVQRPFAGVQPAGFANGAAIVSDATGIFPSPLGSAKGVAINGKA